MPDAIRVARSPIAGRGVFSTEDIPRGALIGTARCVPTTNQGGAYTVFNPDGSAWRMTGKMRFLNHGRPANARFTDDDEVRTLRRIRKGDEILIDYGKGWDSEED